MPASRRSLFCLLNRAATWKKGTKLYLFLMMGINYQFYLHSRHLVHYILNPLLNTHGSAEICDEKHSKKCKGFLSGLVNLGTRESFSHL
jgi:hypothetical protein